MENNYLEGSHEADKDEHKSVRFEKDILSNSTKDSSATRRLRERLKSLESRIRLVRSDFKVQVETLQSRMKSVEKGLKEVHSNMKENGEGIQLT